MSQTQKSWFSNYAYENVMKAKYLKVGVKKGYYYHQAILMKEQQYGIHTPSMESQGLRAP